MKRIIMLVTLAGRRLAADGVPFIDSRYARRVLVLSAMLTAAMVLVLLGYATPSRADVACLEGPNAYCLEKTASDDTVKVGEPLSFTIRLFCPPGTSCSAGRDRFVEDTLPAGLELVSAAATGGTGSSPRCFTLGNQVLCGFAQDVRFDQDNPFVVTIKVIPRQCGTFTNTAGWTGFFGAVSASETFTVVGCPPPTKEQCKNGGWSDPEFAFPNQGTCESTVNRQNRQ
jgi:uncharacterized repeat protein (TIGR01451 family)